MSRSMILGLWVLTVAVAAIAGWFSGISNAARVAQSGAHILAWLFLIAIVAVAAGVGYFSLKLHQHDRTPNNPMIH